jgi:hypothetical protein
MDAPEGRLRRMTSGLLGAQSDQFVVREALVLDTVEVQVVEESVSPDHDAGAHCADTRADISPTI